ncbi:putative thiazole-containing bacteriocin maturation protein [Melghirimyces profundicolus]|uniref:Putative thiazole-containing bacteriocin maturation protein n=1 Tax=Melghirimyces profundicolus TaxID=1242148 RepID=A0A2T6C8R6_9BACL|nr:putative thiazole-containing bacteriocin maturation protein [Melghirimyces profundicolus]PTX64711.1 putative thiazole-containing bacteriocin maturation protein [Melghirimyces profundicolus]
MTELNASMRLKVNSDTYFLPEPGRGVYFRNHSCSFRIEGKTIDQWIEKLIPVFNGDHTLGELTEGLPGPYRERVYEIVETLYRNGFVRDVSRDRPHQLSAGVFERYASQIAFLDSFGGSGAHRFQIYRQAKALAVGSGPFFLSLVSSLLETGLPRFHVLITDSVPTNRERLAELEEHARRADSEVAVEETALEAAGSWREAVQPYDAVLYVSGDGDLEELRALHEACRQEKKVFIPALCLEQTGLAGPLIHPESEGCWESAWRRIHRTALCKDPKVHRFSFTAGAMLANVAVFEWFQSVTGVTDPEQRNAFFLLDLETLEGDWHSFLPHPLITGTEKVQWIEDPNSLLNESSGSDRPMELIPFFGQLTSAESGIFHRWEEGDLKQLPLARCRVQVADPLTGGPAGLLPEKTLSGLTHEEARREAGLAGVEAYVLRMAGRLTDGVVKPGEFVGVGAGETVAEALCRGLQACLDEELGRVTQERNPSISKVRLSEVADERCRFYLEALTAERGEPVIGWGGEVFGFPVIWVGSGGLWFAGVGLNVTMALRKALQQALQGEEAVPAVPGMHPPEKGTRSLEVPACEAVPQPELLQSALPVLNQNQKRLGILDLTVEPFMKEGLAGVFGVLVREEGVR